MGRRPLARLQAAMIARRYFVERRTKSEIADSLQISRFKVARLIDEAIETGLVRFVIADVGELDAELSDALVQRYNLRHAVVVAGPDLPMRDVTEALGQAAAALLEEILVDGQTLAVAWGRTLAATAQAITSLPRIDVVQAIGSLVGEEYSQSSVDLVHRIAALSRGTAYPLYMPMWMEDSALVERLRSEPNVARVLARYARIDVLVSGIGSWNPPNSALFSTFPEQWQTQAERGGTRADLCTILIDEAGAPVATNLADNVLGLSAAQLRAIPNVMGVAGGIEKVDALRAVLRGGWLTTLVTDAGAARRLVKEQ
jgi:DNA-binding transcriptional regulator LsrR (DeoR family)